ncbi:MAG: PHP domain-containing protein [Candidatus Omnitrophica bacterium]|jgi:histidinol phosphatase-like PHP family hydrolase|nr:PHP domain-containing protein [Candidatus Omnitrophota bacterium]
MLNSEIAEIFQQIAELLEIKGENFFKIRAYQRASRTVENLEEEIEEVANKGALRELPGIGADLSEKIKEYIATGTIKTYEELRKSLPPGILELTSVPSIGPKTAQTLYQKLNITSISSLEEALKQNKLSEVAGFKEKTILNIKEGILLAKEKQAFDKLTLKQLTELYSINYKPQGNFPNLIKLEDIKGDLHMHSTFSDGAGSIEEMALAAKERGYSYIAITDHSQGLRIANGLDEEALKKKRAEIDKVNAKLKGIQVLFGTETDIKGDGSLDYSDAILSQFDIVIAAIHSGFKQEQEKITKRVILACKNKYVHIIAHPTGRLAGSRNPSDINMKELLKTAKDTNTTLELNSFPNRLDLNPEHCRLAKENGVRVSIDTDSHGIEHLKFMELGIGVARKGCLETSDVLNTLPLEKLLKTIRK